MTDIEKIAHDIAVSILPHVLAADSKFQYYSPNENKTGENFNVSDVTDEYCTLYGAILEDLQVRPGS